MKPLVLKIIVKKKGTDGTNPCTKKRISKAITKLPSKRKNDSEKAQSTLHHQVLQ